MNREFELRYTGRTEDGREFVRVSHPDFPERHPDHDNGGYVFCNDDREILYREQRYPWPTGSVWDAHYGYAWPVFLAFSLGALACLLAWLLEGDWGAGLLVAVPGAMLIGLARVRRNRKGYAAGLNAVLAGRKATAAPEESGRRAEMRRCAELGLPYLDYDTGRIWTPEDLTVWQERDGERRRKEAEIRTRLEVLRAGEAALRSKYRPRDEFFYPHLWADNRRRLEEIAKERARLTAALESLDRPK